MKVLHCTKWNKYFWLYGLAMIADGIVTICAFGFYYLNLTWKVVVFVRKRELKGKK